MQRVLLFVDLVRQHEQAVAHIDVFAHDAFRDVGQIDGGEIPEFIHAEPHEIFGNFARVFLLYANRRDVDGMRVYVFRKFIDVQDFDAGGHFLNDRRIDVKHCADVKAVV